MKNQLRLLLVYGILLATHHVHSFQVSHPVNMRGFHRQGRTQLCAEDEGIGVGIDLGTTFSAVSILEHGVPILLEIDGQRTMPSIVTLGQDGTEWVGQEALVNAQHGVYRTYRNVKRVIGSGQEAARQVASVVPHLVPTPDATSRRKQKKNPLGWTRQIADAQEHPTMLYSPSDEFISPEVVSSKILRKMFDTAEQYTGKSVDRAVVGVPAYFHDEQRQATIRACELAGVSKVKLLREPEAAALAYGIGLQQVGQGDLDQLVLVFDLGGGTYDVSILVVGAGLTEVISTSGNVFLGGSDFDNQIAQHFNKLLLQHGAKNSFVTIPEVADVMVTAAEAVRIYLSNNKKVQLALPLTHEGWMTLSEVKDIILQEKRQDLNEAGMANGTNVLAELSRKTMESLCREEFQSLLRPLREVAIMSGALLPGDASPSVVESALEMEEELEQSMLDTLQFDDFYQDDENQGPRNATEDTDPDMLLQLQEMEMKEAKKAQQKGRKKAREVAKQEKKFRVEKRKVTDSVPDVKVRDFISGRPISQVVLVGGATRMPAIGRLLSALTGVVPQRTVNPDEAVALGCAVQVGLLDGNEDLGELTVLTPMQAAIMRAVAEQQGLLEKAHRRSSVDDDPDFDDFDDDIDYPDFEGESEDVEF